MSPQTTNFASRLLTWFDQHGRKDLPWQEGITPYRVWLSEIMLQQTQVTTVIPYFQRFVAKFPTIDELAQAPQDEVLQLWTGLGYYARARNLHKAAQQVASHYHSQLPDNLEQLCELPGIGRSTAGAILSIAFKQRAVILDGNVKRVLARHSAITGWPGQHSVAQTLWTIADQHTPDQRVADYTQAIMDLGATLCTRSKPQCHICPVNADCLARQKGDTSQYPGKKPRKTLPIKTAIFLVIRNEQGEVLLEQRPANGIWGSLWSFPETSHDNIGEVLESLGLQPQAIEPGQPQRHTFSHFHLDYQPAFIQCQQPLQIREGQQSWVSPTDPAGIGLPAPVKKLLSTL